ncbi:uncharacterized protein LOC106662896 [Cimex lectularius]|uniref:Daxx histone-binding domain-containing protein n=1 Tax=Cimex lectularius TaxID=79782 RepID=A0A8I6RBP6_CIMLE|nr:uncharacterized protein LOC106662896 [Cimex lectularius]
MECITISSDSEESEIEFVGEKKLERTKRVNEIDVKLLTPQVTLLEEKEPLTNKNDNLNNKLKIKGQIATKVPRRVDFIQIIDDDDTESDDKIEVVNIIRNNILKCTEEPSHKSGSPIPEDPLKIDENEMKKIQDELKMDEKKHLNLRPSNDVSNDKKKEDKNLDEPCSSTETRSTCENASDINTSQIGFNLLDNIVDSCKKLDLGDEIIRKIEHKITKYASIVSKETMKSEKIINFLRKINKEIDAIVKRGDLEREDKFIIIEKIKQVLNELKSDELLVNKKLHFLYSLFHKLKKRIDKLEEMEVESDDEMENPYVLLGRYRAKASQVYEKICRLEEKAPHADRQYLQRFTYSGKGPVQVQRALEKYYNMTRKFPNFKDVLKITNKVNEENKLSLSSPETYEIAQQIFTDFGKKLKIRRQLDDYHILVSYIVEGQKDPATFDQILKTKLDSNKDVWKKKENEIIDFYAKKQAEKSATKQKGNNRKDQPAKSDDESEDSAMSDTEESEEDEKSEDSKSKKHDFSDSEEELDVMLDEDIDGTKQKKDTDCDELQPQKKRKKLRT